VKIAVVGGGGRVGLPFGVVLANAGHSVVAIDIDPQRVAQISQGRAPFREAGLDDLLSAAITSGQLDISLDFHSVKGADVVFVVVGTDLDANGQPQNQSVIAAIEQLSPFVQSDTIVALRSTVMVGTTELVTQLLSQHSKRVAYCPERIAEGKAIEELGAIPQIIGCENTSDTFARLRSLFTTLGVECLRSTPREAELGKLILNAWRYSQFAIANELHQLCEEHGANYQQVRNLVTYKYPRAFGLASAGLAGGPCLEKDTKQLIHGVKAGSRLFGEVLRTHSRMIDYVISSLQSEGSLDDKVVAVLGITFKPESDDTRSSPAMELTRRIELLAKEVIVVDDNVNEPLPFRKCSFADAIHEADIVVVATNHPEFRGLEVKILKVGGDPKTVWKLDP
jgi:UDP-N-acetyl-D-mannosaminuronic acid dehydrogenase